MAGGLWRRLVSALASALLAPLGFAERGWMPVLTVLSVGLGRRLLFLPDVHVHRPGERGYLLGLVGLARPDVVVFGGDLWDEWTCCWEAVEVLVGRVCRAAKVCAAVMGNHEVYSFRTGAGPLGIREAVGRLEDLGVAVLHDEAYGVGGLLVAGLFWRDDPRHYARAAPVVRGAEVVVVHSPDAFPFLPRKAGLTVLAGHTHGGQVCLPRGRSVFTNSLYGYTWGLYRGDGNLMYVARGLGEASGARVWCAREAVLVL